VGVLCSPFIFLLWLSGTRTADELLLFCRKKVTKKCRQIQQMKRGASQKKNLKPKNLSFPNACIGNPEVLNAAKALDPR